jgi:nitrogen fixation/metabolism regulation signal transduction histidine kinase
MAVDAEILRDVLHNLVANSFLHGQADRVMIEVCPQAQEEGCLQLRVIDNGRGISAQNRAGSYRLPLVIGCSLRINSCPFA